MAANAVKYLDGHEVDQGALGSYIISASVAQYKERAKPAPAPAATEGSYDPFENGDGEPMDADVAAEVVQPAVLLSNMFDIMPRLGGFYQELRSR